MSDPVLEKLVDVSVQALTGLAAQQQGLDRDTLAARWSEAGIEWKSNWRYHIIWWLCQNGIAVFGPVQGGEPRLVLADEWIPSSRRLEGDDALAELATRYPRGRGAVREKDLAWWTGLPLGEARRALRLAEEDGSLVRAQLDGTEGPAGALWVPRELLGAPLDAAPSRSADWLLLPSFDEHLLGYTNRDAQLDPRHFERIVPGRNGMFLATVLVNGRIVGTWRRSKRKHVGLEVTALPGEHLDTAALTPAAERWAAFTGEPESIVVDDPKSVAGAVRGSEA